MQFIEVMFQAAFSIFVFAFIGILVVDFINYLKNYPPFVCSKSSDLEHIYRFIDKNKSYEIVDLGSGNAKVLINVAKNTDANLHGFEINPIVCLISKVKIKILKMGHKVKVYRKDFLEIDFSHYDIFYVYSIGGIQNKIEDKLLKEANKGSYVISNKFKFDNIEHLVSSDNLHLYRV